MLIKLEIQLSVRRLLWLSHSFVRSLTHSTERHSEKVALFGVTVYSVLTPNRWWETGSSNDNQPQSIHSYKQSQFSYVQFNTQEFVVWSTTSTLNSKHIGIATCLHFAWWRITFVHNPFSKCTTICHHTNTSAIMFLYHESDTAHLVLETNSWQEHIQISGAFGESKTRLKYCFKFRSADRSPYTKWR